MFQLGDAVAQFHAAPAEEVLSQIQRDRQQVNPVGMDRLELRLET